MKQRDLRIVLFDIEIIPDWHQAKRVWPMLGRWPNTLRASITSIICFGWKELGKKRVHCVNAWDYPDRWANDINDDYEICKVIYEVLKDADVVVTQNGKKFDWPHVQTRLLKHGFPALPRIVHVDTKEVAKQNLYFFSNSLKIMARFLTETDKRENDGWDLWVDVMEKKPKAMREMALYCKQDVRVLEEIFLLVRPFVKNMPNANMFKAFDGPECCPNCGGFDLIKHGRRVTKTQVYQRLLCKSCGTAMIQKPKAKYPEVIAP